MWPVNEISEIKTFDISKVPYETMTLLYKAKGLFENVSILKIFCVPILNKALLGVVNYRGESKSFKELCLWFKN